MKRKLFSQLLTISILALGATAIISEFSLENSSQVSLAQTPSYFCEVKDNKPTTFVQTSRGRIPVILWVNDNNVDPYKRCKEVSTRFQSASNNGELKFIYSGQVNDSTVLCYSSQEKTPCTSANTLFTILENDENKDAESIVEQLTGIGYRPVSEIEIIKM